MSNRVMRTASVSAAAKVDLESVVRGHKARISCALVSLSMVEVVVGLISLDTLESARKMFAKASNDNLQANGKEGGGNATVDADDVIDSGVVEVILFAIPFMLVTNVLVFVSMARDNVWLLLPWMVLHCVVIAFLSLGMAILSLHGRLIVGLASLLAAILLLLSWKAIRQLFMKMVDKEMNNCHHHHNHHHDRDDDNDDDGDNEAIEMSDKHARIFFGCKNKQQLLAQRGQ